MPYIIYDRDGRTMFARVTIDAECQLDWRTDDEDSASLRQEGWEPLADHLPIRDYLYQSEALESLSADALIWHEDVTRVLWPTPPPEGETHEIPDTVDL